MNEFEKEIIARLSSIEDRLSALELPNIRLGPNPDQEKALERDRESTSSNSSMPLNAKFLPLTAPSAAC